MTDTLRLTHVGGPTLLIQLGGWNLLVDPTFDPPGRRYGFALGTSSVKLAGPAVPLEDLPPIDAVLLSHDHHADNLDDAGRRLLPQVPRVVSTAAAARRLRMPSVTGLKPWSATELAHTGRPTLRVTATPCRHGPPLSRPVVGEVVGFVIEPADKSSGALWITGDTVTIPALAEVPRRFDVDTMVMHLGRVRFGLTGPLRYSMDGHDAVELLRTVRPRRAVPVHYEGWSHFSEPVSDLRRAVDGAEQQLRERVVWLSPGVPTPV
ncbi:MBL fold metallo-hydrolase [Isoptericola aurantiacus]|uniref:MBL fold metallo-hydrolase n=1 Tax=Isoptericola aurantiacus TaxID=3377839 RepID=UPI00383B4644